MDVCTGPLARWLTRSLAPPTRSLARALARSLARSGAHGSVQYSCPVSRVNHCAPVLDPLDAIRLSTEVAMANSSNMQEEFVRRCGKDNSSCTQLLELLKMTPSLNLTSLRPLQQGWHRGRFSDLDMTVFSTFLVGP